jgi:hypothetical protein
MIRKYWILIGLVCAPSLLFAQFEVALQGNFLRPVSQIFKNYYGSGVGGSLALRYRNQENVVFGAMYSYNFLFTKGPAQAGVSTNFNRFAAQLEYYFIKASNSAFIAIEPGYYTMSYNQNIPGFSNISISESTFGLAPVLGYYIQTAEKLSTTLGIRYHYLFNFSNNNLAPNQAGVIPYGENAQLFELNIGLIYAFN